MKCRYLIVFFDKEILITDSTSFQSNCLQLNIFYENWQMLDKRFRGLHNFPGGVKYGKIKVWAQQIQQHVRFALLKRRKGRESKGEKESER